MFSYKKNWNFKATTGSGEKEEFLFHDPGVGKSQGIKSGLATDMSSTKKESQWEGRKREYCPKQQDILLVFRCTRRYS